MKMKKRRLITIKKVNFNNKQTIDELKTFFKSAGYDVKIK